MIEEVGTQEGEKKGEHRIESWYGDNGGPNVKIVTETNMGQKKVHV